MRKGRTEEARKELLRSVSPDEAEVELAEMQALKSDAASAEKGGGSLLRRKYVIPFVLACIVLSCNQATGINSILSFLVIILRQAGMSVRHATQGDLIVKVINCAITMVAVLLVDRKGRKFLLKLGTAGVVLALSAAGILFLHIESSRTDVKTQVQTAEIGNRVKMPLNGGALGTASNDCPMALRPSCTHMATATMSRPC